ncbi:MAG: prephenate dehydrogenase [Firmicutes bacterium]|nr:prephenate dehydrogenase [Bacillota bacterium]
MMNKKFSIIGLGLIGGSLARAFCQRLNIQDITAVDKNTDSINQALKDGNISRGFTEVNEYVWNSDVIFICTPVKSTIEYIKKLYKKTKPRCIVTDVGSTKSEIISYINNLSDPPCFIGGHPMAGTEKTGYASSFSHLFENAYYVLTPSKSTSDESLSFMIELIKGIGGIPVVVDALVHDRATAGISHVPHIIASALVNLIKEIDFPDGKMQMLAAGGFKDITRIASSNPEMWQSIILSNKQQVEDILNVFISNLSNILQCIKEEREKEIYSFFESAKNYRNTFAEGKKGPISPVYQLTVDVVDKPGIIGEIATILGKNNINIKNINVSHSREFEQGCLIISLHDNESLNSAFNLLYAAGYKVYKRI